MTGLFEMNFPANPSDMRALSQTELQERQNAQYAMMAQAQLSLYNSLAYMNCIRPAPERRPLDERFADFKLRLSKALEKRKN